MPKARVVLLGPQRLQPTLDKVVDSLGVAGRIAAVTAGWEERESEDDELRDHLGGRTINLKLFERWQDVAHRDPELFEAARERHDVLREIHEIYQLRLAHELDAARELMRRESTRARREDASTLYGGARNHDRDSNPDGWIATRASPRARHPRSAAGPKRTVPKPSGSPARPEILATECEAAIEAVRALDAFHLARIRALHEEWNARWKPLEREAVAQHRREIASILQDVSLVCIAGGHVIKLLDHLRHFGLMEMVPPIPVIGWSAGAMVLAERIVLFHDSPPQGPGNPEVFESGLGSCPGVVPLPHASRRLALGDTQRVALMARRFRPAMCAALDPKTRIEWNGKTWTGDKNTMQLCEDGHLSRIGAA